MKKAIFTLFVIILCKTSFGQLTAEQRIQDSIIGWWDNNRFDNRIKPTTDPVQKKRIEIDDLIAGWMKRSYTPVGGLGTVTRQNFKNSFGVYFMVWNVSYNKMWLDDKGHFTPIAEENTPFGINANNIPASYAVPFLNSGGDYYFTWPPDGYHDKQLYKNADPKIHPNVYKFITRINEVQTVLLAPNNKLPFLEVTKGEYLDAAEASLDKEFQKKKESIDGQWTDTKSRESAYAYQQKEFDRYRNAIHKWKEKYKEHLDEPAVLHNMQPTLISDFFGDMDPFSITAIEKEQHQYFPLFKVTAAVMEKCKTAQPQWIAVWFRYQTKENGNQLYEMYRSLTENLNYDYIYNYFFDPEKVKGKSYTAVNEDQLKARLDGYRKKIAAAISTVLPVSSSHPEAFFFDDFSTSSEGGDPANWYFRRYGKHAVVKILKNQAGKWLQLGYGTPASPSLLKKPFPGNFTLALDIATDGDFTSRTGGAVNLSINTRPATADGTQTEAGNGATINIDIIAGNENDYNNNNYMGMLRVKINATPEVNIENYSGGLSYEYPLREFTNKKTTIHLAVKVKDNVVTVLVNNIPVAVSTNFKMTYGGRCVSCGVTPGAKFNSVYWTNITSDADNNNVYISNIKITKE